ncbi:hypothetical protein KFZ76_16625 [Methylovulum psychrotolerans]|uniref:hypothetical protein n=1 Tax=Methylovulum psychrotolerans TaxID=1704499 RepID=UPI001BFFCE95|nr:hypothetical protein [Methylovulum psychrotolerans]MBT9099321.1 hypothetical protein [Methylovulum psychrotolerans]
MRYCKSLVFATLLLNSQLSPAQTPVSITVIDNHSPGYYNYSLKTLLDGKSLAFPIPDNDYPMNFPSAPDLNPVQTKLGGWLQNPPVFSTHWTSTTIPIPHHWRVNNETAIVYPIDVPSSGYKNLTISIGVDNGVFVWIDGQYLGGSIVPGGVVRGENTYKLQNLNAGKHYLQVLREDHGGIDGYTIRVKAQAQANALGTQAHQAKKVTWMSIAGIQYQAQWSIDSIIWNDLGGLIAGDNTEKTVFDPIYDESRSYRIVELQ